MQMLCILLTGATDRAVETEITDILRKGRAATQMVCSCCIRSPVGNH